MYLEIPARWFLAAMTEELREEERRRELRKRAEIRLAETQDRLEEMDGQQIRKLLYELRTHQIELEMQNEELRAAQTALAEERDRYTALYDFAPVGYVTLGDNNVILEANLTVTDMLGIDRAKLLETRLTDYICPKDQDKFYQLHRRVTAAVRKSSCRVRMMKSGEEEFWASIEARPIGVLEDQSAVLRVTVSDITDRVLHDNDKKKIENRLHRAKKFESLNVLAGGVAHNFNNFLSVIQLNAEMLKDRFLTSSETRENVLMISNASRRLAYLVQQLLTFVGKTPLRRETTNPVDFVQEIIEELRRSVADSATFAFIQRGNIPEIQVDPERVRQAIRQIVSNSIEATGDGGGQILLTVGTIQCDQDYYKNNENLLPAFVFSEQQEGPFVYIEVRDTGPGMDKQMIENICDPFFSSNFQGRGLGMSSVIGILQAHDGMLEISSKLHEGTTIRILLPASMDI